MSTDEKGMLASYLPDATVTYTGEVITIMYRKRDSLKHEFKKAMSLRCQKPLHFIFHSRQGYKQEWYTNGECHNPFGGAAMHSVTDTIHYEQHNTSDGIAGCDYGPAIIDHAYGKHYHEKWISTTDNEHREGGPSSTTLVYESPPVSGKSRLHTRTMKWNQNGRRGNGDSWTFQVDATGVEVFEPISGGLMRTLEVVTRDLYWHDEDGMRHRTNGPAHIKFTGFKEIEKNGKVTWTWKDWNGDWYIRGEEIPYGKILKWAKRYNILMWNEPCYDRSAFRTDDGEFLFITDFAQEKK